MNRTQMDQQFHEIIQRLARIEEQNLSLRQDLDRDFALLHGGTELPGLDARIHLLEQGQQTLHQGGKFAAGIIGFAVNTAIALYAVFRSGAHG